MSEQGGVRLAALAEEHEAFRAALFRALDALVAGDGAAARARFDAFAAEVEAHAAAEEAHLIPRFADLGLESVGCTASILRADHDKLRRLLDAGRGLLAGLGAEVAPRTRVEGVLAMRGLIELLAHHDQRERTAFFPPLDEALPATDRAALYALCARSHASA